MKELTNHISKNLSLIEEEFIKDLKESIEDFQNEEIETIFFEIRTYGLTRFFPVQTWFRDNEDCDLDHLHQPSFQHIKKKVLDSKFIESYESQGINTFFEAAQQIAEFIKASWIKANLDVKKEVVAMMHERDFKLVVQTKPEQ